MILQGQVGAQANADGVLTTLRQGRAGEAMVSELNGRFYEQTYRNNTFSIGCALTALAAATILLTASAQPIVGVWNPTTSSVNLVILQATLKDQINTATTPAAPGDFVWAASVGNTSLTAGLAPFNRKSLSYSGSQARAFALSTVSLLTGLTNNVVVIEPGDFVSNNVLATTIASDALSPMSIGTQNFDGQLIVPPGGVLALLNTASTTAHSVSARLLWAELPL